MTDDVRGAVEAVWRIEGMRIVASVAKMTGDLGLAEDVAQDAVLEALASWRDGVPRNAGAWLTAVAKRRAIDAWRRRGRLDERYATLARKLDEASDDRQNGGGPFGAAHRSVTCDQCGAGGRAPRQGGPTLRRR